MSNVEPFDTLFPDVCCYCGNSPVTCDEVGFIWCADCDHRRLLMNKGKLLNFPLLKCEPYAIGPGVFCWAAAITSMDASDDFIWLALAKLEYEEQLTQEAS